MARIALIVPGPGAPYLLPLDAVAALRSGRVLALPGDPVAERLVGLGIEVELVEGRTGSRTRFDVLATIGHGHGDEDPQHAALATAAIEALAGGDVCVIEPDERFRRALMRRVLEAGAELEFVTGAQAPGATLLEVVRTMEVLHGPDGCPWDREQTHQSLAKSLIDECYELLDAIEAGGPAEIREELGDVLLQVVFHAQLGRAAGAFDIDDVAAGLDAKLKRRHPHVFGDVEVADAGEVVRNWDAIKREEKQGGVFEGVPEALPALAYAQKLLRRAISAGLDQEPAAGGLDEEALGDELFRLVAGARAAGIDAETALRGAARRYRTGIEEAEAGNRINEDPTTGG